MSDFERTLKQHLVSYRIVSYRKVRTVYARDLGGGRDDAVERLLPEARGRAERVADAHQDASERRRQVEVVDEEAVVLEAAERQPDRHERDGARPLRAVDEAARRHHARRHDATCSRPARHGHAGEPLTVQMRRQTYAYLPIALQLPLPLGQCSFPTR